MVALDQRHLRDREDHRQRDHAERLEPTQKSVLWVRQTISFRIAIAKKNSAQRSVRRASPAASD
jgi:hypothetical protein